MRAIEGVSLDNVTAAYGGAQADLYTLMFGELLHVGGMAASLDLADRAGIGAGMRGVDLCCGLGSAMRLLVRLRGVGAMAGVDVTPRNVERGQQRCREQGLEGQARLVLADATDTGLPSAEADFVWGEDAWCYVADKARLVAEAARLVRPGGVIAFTDWVEGPEQLGDADAERFLRMMSFANIEDVGGYRRLLTECDAEVLVAEDTGRMASYFDLYINMLEMQLTFDALATVGYRPELLGAVMDNLRFICGLAHAGQIGQARFVARRR